ncbi:MAG: hypothetical protein OEZ68_18985 [Gammaproteobacteria bacterium]|nr:hypothetical protein [Gammaproteobacteria bacterium]MDH5802893.1 hypothetical protein [Gammaproteobacteria bacterium]
MKRQLGWMVLVFLLPSTFYQAVLVAKTDTKEQPQELIYEDKFVEVKIIPRSPEQMLAFYEGRGFPVMAKQRIAKACFFTVIIQNKSNNRLWLDMSQWQFGSKDQSLRLDRHFWQQQWDEIQLAPAYRSTFGWTLLPEERGLFPEEGVGGNVTLRLHQEAVTWLIEFPTNDNRKGKRYRVPIGPLQCKLK